VAGDRSWSLPGHGHRRLFGCQRSSPAVAEVVAAVHEKNFAIRRLAMWIDVSRSRRGIRLPSARRTSAEMKKAAEVDFTWAAFAGTYEKRVLLVASPVTGKRLENLGHRRLYCSRASGGIDVVAIAKQTFAPAPRHM